EEVRLQWKPRGAEAARQGVVVFWKSETDANGFFEWPSAPPFELSGSIWKDGFTDLRIELRADRDEITYTLQKAARVTGTVRDAESHEGIAEFKVFPLTADELQHVEMLAGREMFFGKDGRYDIQVVEPDARALRIDAKIYEPLALELVPVPATLIQLHFALTKQTYLKGIVALADGKPVAGAQVQLGTWTHPVSINGAR